MATSLVTSFPPISSPQANTLILGSMPGKASLEANQYYAHPRNAFWPILANLYQFDATMAYDKRIAAIQTAKVAIWDVLAQCIRPGSLDSAIEQGSRTSNDFVTFFQQHPNIKLIAFNGGEAEKSFNRFALPKLQLLQAKRVRLPSTSPAHTITVEKKLAMWKAALFN